MTETLTVLEGEHVPDPAPGATLLVQHVASAGRTHDDDQLSDAARGRQAGASVLVAQAAVHSYTARCHDGQTDIPSQLDR